MFVVTEVEVISQTWQKQSDKSTEAEDQTPSGCPTIQVTSINTTKHAKLRKIKGKTGACP